MANNINLLPKAHKKREYRRLRNIAKSGTFIFILFLLILGTGIYAYWFILKKESETLDEKIATAEVLIASYSDVETGKSVLTVKTKELQSLHESRFDYLKTIKNIDSLFGFSLDIESISIDETGTVEVEAVKTGEITLSEEEAFDTNITTMTLNLIVASSDELEKTLENLERYVGRGLERVTISSSELTEDQEYKVAFEISFTNTASPIGTTEQVDNIDENL